MHCFHIGKMLAAFIIALVVAGCDGHQGVASAGRQNAVERRVDEGTARAATQAPESQVEARIDDASLIGEEQPPTF